MNGGWLQGGDEAENQRWPPWLKPLLATSFFGQCKMHADAHKCECNMYCLDCISGALCSQCLAYHHGHHAIQVRQPFLSLKASVVAASSSSQRPLFPHTHSKVETSEGRG